MNGCSYRLQTYPAFLSTTFNLHIDITNWEDLKSAYVVLNMIHTQASGDS